MEFIEKRKMKFSLSFAILDNKQTFSNKILLYNMYVTLIMAHRVIIKKVGLEKFHGKINA